MAGKRIPRSIIRGHFLGQTVEEGEESNFQRRGIPGIYV
jgi:hypothetical protein